MNTGMLAPAAVLVAWSLIMLLWMGVVRQPALKNAGVTLRESRGKRGQDLEGVVTEDVMWKSHNYTHLMEQPTLFYALVLILALAGNDGVDVILAWAYVAVRVVHSLWQATVNTVPVRLTLFTLGTLVLIAFTVKALMATLFAGPGALGL